jgi:hypothetical protein
VEIVLFLNLAVLKILGAMSRVSSPMEPFGLSKRSIFAISYENIGRSKEKSSVRMIIKLEEFLPLPILRIPVIPKSSKS